MVLDLELKKEGRPAPLRQEKSSALVNFLPSLLPDMTGCAFALPPQAILKSRTHFLILTLKTLRRRRRCQEGPA